MPLTSLCPRCRVPLAHEDVAAVCPGCLLALALEEAAPQRRDRPPGSAAMPVRIGGYRIVETLGEGGMGVVYLAEQEPPLSRRVAIKVIKLGMDTREVIARFESERRAMALMAHPNIASVFDAGSTDDGRPYFVMEYVPGIPITEYSDREQFSTRARLALFTEVCAAVQHAHQKGIIHRDLKPTNVLVMEQDGGAVPKVIDFGVAKAIDRRAAERTLFTEHGLLIGTPEYMSPEQAWLGERDLDTRTDIYSLGVLLYELLVGALPFEIRGLRRAGYDELRRVIQEEEPVRPSTRVEAMGRDASEVAERRQTNTMTLRRQLRGDLDWITLRALEKEPARRYASASELAADIDRHLTNDPVVAGPPGAAYRVRKFARKHRAAVAAAAAILIVSLTGFTVSTGLFMRADAARQQAESQRREAERQRALAEAATGDARQQRDVATQQREAAEVARVEAAAMTVLANEQRAEADRQRLEAQRRAYAANIAGADAHLQAFNPGEAMRLLSSTPTSLRGWEWGYLTGKADRAIAALPAYGRFSIFPETPPFLFAADGSRLWWHTEQTVHAWDAVSYRPLSTRGGPEFILALGPGGTVILTRPRQPGEDFSLTLRDAGPRDPLAALSGHTSLVEYARFSRDGRRLATGATNEIRVWDVPSRRLLTTLRLTGSRSATFSPDGSLLAAIVDQAVHVMKVDDGQPVVVLTGHTKWVGGVDFSPDGSRLASAAADHTVRIWHLPAGAPAAVLTGHTMPVFAVAFSPDGTKLASGAQDGTVRLWDAQTGSELTAWPHGLFGASSVGFDPQGERVFSASTHFYGADIRVWDATVRYGFRLVETPVKPRAPMLFTPDGGSLAACSERGAVFAVDLGTGKARPWLETGPVPITALALDASGTRVASGHADGTLKLWDARSGKLLHDIVRAHGADIRALAFSRDGRDLASGSRDRTVRIWAPPPEFLASASSWRNQ